MTSNRNNNPVFAPLSSCMQLIVYILTFPVLWLFSMLPMRVLFLLSDLVYYILYYLVRYRRKVVRQNLRLSFPDKSEEELKRIEKRTFRHFVHTFFEMIKSFTISEKEISRRLSITNPELLDPYYDKGQSVIFLSGHYASWLDSYFDAMSGITTLSS